MQPELHRPKKDPGRSKGENYSRQRAPEAGMAESEVSACNRPTCASTPARSGKVSKERRPRSGGGHRPWRQRARTASRTGTWAATRRRSRCRERGRRGGGRSAARAAAAEGPGGRAGEPRAGRALVPADTGGWSSRAAAPVRAAGSPSRPAARLQRPGPRGRGTPGRARPAAAPGRPRCPAGLCPSPPRSGSGSGRFQVGLMSEVWNSAARAPRGGGGCCGPEPRARAGAGMREGTGEHREHRGRDPRRAGGRARCSWKTGPRKANWSASGVVTPLESLTEMNKLCQREVGPLFCKLVALLRVICRGSHNYWNTMHVFNYNTRSSAI